MNTTDHPLFHPQCRLHSTQRLLVCIWRHHGRGETEKANALVDAVEQAVGIEAWQPAELSTINSQPSTPP